MIRMTEWVMWSSHGICFSFLQIEIVLTWIDVPIENNTSWNKMCIISGTIESLSWFPWSLWKSTPISVSILFWILVSSAVRNFHIVPLKQLNHNFKQEIRGNPTNINFVIFSYTFPVIVLYGNNCQNKILTWYNFALH